MNMDCDRCGRCCYEFSHQIHFLSDETFILKPIEFQDNFVEEKVQLYHKYMDKFKKKTQNKMRFFIPTKKQIFPYLNSQSQKYLIDEMVHPNECMFLSWQERLASCEIHQYNPQMCKDYPTAKGGVCKGHPEKKYTKHFYYYQKQKIGFAIQALEQIYSERINSPIAFEILTILMDFGDFNLDQLMVFFEKDFFYSKSEIVKAMDDLKDLGLIFQEQNRIQGISLKEVEAQIDEVMKRRGWQYPH
ncbi:hypothetical protein WKT22_01412 [Candidatus Lokiarchaeum ossiferum]